MSTVTRRRAGLGLALLVALVPFAWRPAEAAPDADKNTFYAGKVVPLAELAAKHGARLDGDAAPHWLVLAADDGKVYPLFKDDGARMFFKDPRLLQRPMRLTGRLLPGSGVLQVVEVHSLKQGAPHELYYWCDICAIKRFEKKICECCQGPMELREEPRPR